MLWAAFVALFFFLFSFGFLCTGEFTMCPPSDPSIHLAVGDLQVNALFQDMHQVLEDRPLSGEGGL